MTHEDVVLPYGIKFINGTFYGLPVYELPAHEFSSHTPQNTVPVPHKYCIATSRDDVPSAVVTYIKTNLLKIYSTEGGVDKKFVMFLIEHFDALCECGVIKKFVLGSGGDLTKNLLSLDSVTYNVPETNYWGCPDSPCETSMLSNIIYRIG